MWQSARFVGFGSLLAVMLALASEEVVAQKKDKKAEPKDGNPAVPADYLQLQAKKEIVGTILNVGGGGKTVALRVEFPHMEPNPNFKPPQGNPKLATNPQNNPQAQYMKRYQDLMRQKEQAMRAKSPQEQQRAMQRYQMEMAKLQMQMQQGTMYPKDGKGGQPKVNPNNQPFIVVTTTKDYEFEIQDGAAVRKLFLALEYDDTGNIKQYTEKEKAELRGTDKTKPGYQAKMDEVVAGTEVRLLLTPPKAKKKAEDDGVGNVERPSVNMIILTKDSPTPGIVGADPKKKKDKK